MMNKKKIKTKIREFEAENKSTVVFGMAQGSYMKGIETALSDYDFRFYYVKEDFIDHIIYPDNADDRLYVSLEGMSIGNKACDLGLFEMTMFLYFLVTPSLNHMNKDYGLYMEICSAFTNPYIWDRFNIKGILFPALETLFRPDFLISHHLIKLQEAKADSGILKTDIDRLFRALSINWIINYKKVPPVYMKTLLLNVDETVKESACKLIKNYKNKAEAYSQKCISGSNQHIIDEIDLVLEKYIQEQIISGNSYLIQYICPFDENRAGILIKKALIMLHQILQNVE